MAGGGHLHSEGLDPRHHCQPGARGAPRPVCPAAEDRQRASSISWALGMLKHHARPGLRQRTRRAAGMLFGRLGSRGPRR